MVDYGIDKLRSQWSPRYHLPIEGQFAYMSLEELRGWKMDRRVDVYALGVVLYELLTARKPFESTSDSGVAQAILSEPMVLAERHRPDLPGALRAILVRALAKERDQRYPDCHVFQADLEAFILSGGEPVTPRQVAWLIQQVTASDDPAVIAPVAPCSGR